MCRLKFFRVNPLANKSFTLFAVHLFNFLISFFRFSFSLEKTRELEIAVYWRDWRSLCAVKFLRLEEFVDDLRHGMALQLEPQGLLFAEVIQLNKPSKLFSPYPREAKQLLNG